MDKKKRNHIIEETIIMIVTILILNWLTKGGIFSIFGFVFRLISNFFGAIADFFMEYGL